MENKILIVVGGSTLLDARLATEIARNHNVKIGTLEEAKELNKSLEFNASSLVLGNSLFQPPKTRQERRKIEREKNKKRK